MQTQPVHLDRGRFPTWILERPGSAERIEGFFTPVVLTVSQIVHHARSSGGTGTATFTLRYGADPDDVGTEIVVGGSTATNTSQTIVVFSNGSIPANSWVWLQTTATTNSPTLLAVALVVS